jgi:hemerythrin-like domain-containing protein
MQSSLSELFIAEHDVILGAGDLITLHRSQWKSDPAGYEQMVKQLLGFFSVYADQFHHHKEEEILFPAISKMSESAGVGIVTELNGHHEDFRLLMQKIRAALAIHDLASTQQLLESYIHQLRDHIAVENDELFPMANDIFSKDEVDKLYYKCIDIDEGLGKTRKKELEDLIKNLTLNETVQ